MEAPVLTIALAGLALLSSCTIAPPAASVACASSPPSAGPVVHSLALEDRTSGSFVRMSVLVTIDNNAAIVEDENQSGPTRGKKGPLGTFIARVGPGSHTIAVKLTYRGHGEGVFSYLKGYRFRAEGTHAFAAAADGLTVIRAIEQGGPTTPLEERLAVAFEDVCRAPVR